MTEHLSDQEQIQMLKNWWKQYGMTLVIGLCVFLSASYGWRYWQQYKTHQTELASMIYSEVINLNDMNKADEVKLLTENLLKNYPRTVYASLAALIVAKDAVESDKLADAEQKLQWVVDKGKQKALQQLARIRLARVLLADKKPTEALAVLAKLDVTTALTAEAAEVKGDVLVVLGKKAEALQSYQIALTINKVKAVESPLLQMKIQEVQ